MQRMGLTTEERIAFEETIRSSHVRRITVAVTDLAGSVLAHLTPVLLDGQVIVDGDATVTRSATLSFFDPAHTLNFDTNSPDDGALYADRMLKITYSVLVPALSRYVDVPVFHGPVTKLDRKGDVVDVEAQGKEALAMGALWSPVAYGTGTKTVDAIVSLLRDRAGESLFSIPDHPARLPTVYSFDRTSTAWEAALTFAGQLGQQLFYSGDGVATLRTIPNVPVYTFRTGNGGDVLSEISASNVLDDVANTIVVLGGVPTGTEDRITAVAMAEPTHALSPQRLGRQGVPRYLVREIDEDAIMSFAEADARARQELFDALLAVMDVSFDSLPIPHLEPGDLVRVDAANGEGFTFRLSKFSIPLGTSGNPTMPVGYTKKTTINRGRLRR